jgi:radical SAM protein with 4Fe4S-binding SPASM domain
MIKNYNIIGTILFSQSLAEIKNQLNFLKKDSFGPVDRIIIEQDSEDEYPYVDGVGKKLIEIQKIINQVDISNCFVLLVTTNKDVAHEINFITKFYSVDSNPIEFLLLDGNYKKEIKKYNDTSCQKLWNHLYVGTDGNINPCCLADHRFPLGNIDNEDINAIVINRTEQIKIQMAQGYRNRACSGCYEKEDSGIDSARLPCDPIKTTMLIEDIDVRLNNICNFKCRMCSEYFSSAIQQETIKIYGKSPVLGFEKISLSTVEKNVRNQRLEKILPYINSNLKRIYFAGGEPLITDEHYQILDRLIKINNSNLKLSYNTNLSTLTYKQMNVIDRWQEFSDVTVGASIDASGIVAEYVRHGTIWNDIVANIHTIKQKAPHVQLQISSTVSFLTIENLINLQTMWIKHKLFDTKDFSVNVLTSPDFMSPAALPQHHKDRLQHLIQNHICNFEGTRLAHQWHNVLQCMNNNDYTVALDNFRHRTSVLDVHRNQSFVSVFPEFKDLFILTENLL